MGKKVPMPSQVPACPRCPQCGSACARTKGHLIMGHKCGSCEHEW